jgi:hypothetical protein
LTGLFKSTSPFSKPKNEFKTKVAGIPDLLISAVEDVQHSLELAKSWGEGNDPLASRRIYRVGTGEEDDVDPADIDDALELMERSKKYLRGEVPISWNKGTRNLAVNFPKLFQREGGLQDWLPHFVIRPYAEWNDTLEADTTWESPTETYYYPWQRPLKLGLGYEEDDWELSISSPNPGEFHLEVNKYDPDLGFQEEVVATLTQDSDDPCQFHYLKEMDRVEIDQYEYQSVENISEGTFTVSGCRETDPGSVEVISYINAMTKGPFFFTNPAGEQTFGPESLLEEDIEINQPGDLAGKIFWRDPTFGGIFPNLTNENFWETLNSFEEIETRTWKCEEVEVPFGTDPDTGEVLTYIEEDCFRMKPENPSDLDLLVWVISRPSKAVQDVLDLDADF